VEVKVEDSGFQPTVSSIRSPSCPSDLNMVVARSSAGDTHSSYFLELHRDGSQVRYDITALDALDDVNYVFERKMRHRMGITASPAEELAVQAKLGHHSEGEAVLEDGGAWVLVASGSWDDGKGYRISLRAPL
jgi:hypothetical protein